MRATNQAAVGVTSWRRLPSRPHGRPRLSVLNWLRAVTLPLLCALLLAASRASLAHDSLPPGIAWIDGDVEGALSQAQAQGRPLFLYWGAVWCPPCNQVKSLLFRRSDFQQRLRGFIPVYLDGDGEAAQRWGDRFRVVGYPTLLVLNAKGEELSRVAGEIDPERLLRVLDGALQAGRPATELLAHPAEAAGLGPNDWLLLASHGWELDTGIAPDTLARQLGALAQVAPASPPELRGRLWLHALAGLDKPLKEWNTEGARAALSLVLTDPVLARDNRDLLIQSPFHAIEDLGPLPADQRAQLAQQWDTALQALTQDNSITCTERLTLAWAAADLAHGGRDPVADALPPPQQQRAHALVASCDTGTTDEIERQSVMSAASDLLQEVGLHAEAASLIEREIPRAHVPAYFMQERAALARKLGQGPDAIEWSGLSYANAQGGATRLQWGVRHLKDLVSYAPESRGAIVDFAAVLVRDAALLPDAFADRNLRSLQQLQKLVGDWAAQRPADESERGRLATAWSRLCQAAPAGDARSAALCRGPALSQR